MKLLKTILAMLVFLPVMGLAANLQEGLVAHYKFDGDAKDASGNGHDLVNNGATLTVDRFGNNNGAYHFDGQSFLRSIQDEDLILTTNSGAVSGWFKAEKNISTFYSESTSGTCYAAPYAFAPPCGDNNVGTAGVGFAVGANGVMVYEHAGNYLPTPLVYKGDLGNEWNHICVTLKDNGAEQLYINGKFVKGGVKSYKTKFIGIPCVDGIGGCRYGYFTGAIDDVRVYSRALSDEEVMALYQEETARWKVGFDAVGGVASTNEITVIDRMPVSVLPTVEDWDGHNFLGWFTAAEGGERVTSETVITSNVTFYAHWRDLSKEMLIAHYKFDGDAKDASGNGYDLNGDVAMWGAGRYGDLNGAAWFSGSGYYTPETWFNVQNSMTISVWVKPDKDITLYNEGQACSTDNNGVIIYPSHGGASGTIAGLGVFVGKNGVVVGEHAADYNPVVLSSKIDLAMHWSLVTVTMNDNGAPILYVNGLYVKTGMVTSRQKYLGVSKSSTPYDDSSLIGGGRSWRYYGAMDDLRIYDHALSEEEVMALYQEEVARWKVGFDAVGGVASTNEITVADRMTISTLPAVEEWENHKFLGWFTAAEGGEMVTGETVITSNVTFYAHWRDLSKEMLIAHYEFDGDATDSSGNHHDGEVLGATLTTDRFGNSNRAYLFGSDKYISVPNDEQLANVRSNVTIAVWIRPTNWDREWVNVLCKGKKDSVNRNIGFSIHNKYGLQIPNHNGTDYVGMSVNPALNRWMHVAYTSDGNMIHVYLNGKLVGSKQMALGSEENDDPLDIGRDAPGSIEYFRGAMDDLRIYNYALTEAEIQEVYHEDDVAEFLCTQYEFTVQPNSLSAAESYLDNSSNMSGVFVTKGYRTISFEKGASGLLKFPAVPFPGMGVIGSDSFAMVARARIWIPESGVWTFVCGSDDGFRMRIWSSDYSDSMVVNEKRSYAITLKQFTIPASGYYEFELTHFEWGGGASCELSVAKGAYSSFDASAFKLVGTAESGITLVGKKLDYVTFAAQGGICETEMVKVEHDTAVGPLPLVERKPYRFLGWFTEAEGGEMVTADTVITNDVTCYAHWQEPTMADVMGATNAVWRTGGAADWRIEETNGSWSVRSGAIGKSSETWIECVVTNGCRVSYAWKVSSEPGEDGEMYDYLSLSVDGEPVDAICGESGWTNGVVFVVGAGEHVLRWTYQKDSRTTEGEDCGWLGKVQVDPEVAVSFNANGATSGEAPSFDRVYLGDTIVIPGHGTLSRSCHDFSGWMIGETVYAEGDELAVDSNELALSAVWSAKTLAAVTLQTPVMSHVTTEKIAIEFNMPENATAIRYTVDGSEPTVESALYNGGFEVSDQIVTVKAIAYADDWFSSACATWVLTRAPWSAPECLNLETRNFTLGGDVNWGRDLAVTHDGVAAMRSGTISNKQKSDIAMVVNGSGTLSFWCKVSSECDPEDGEVYDGLTVEVDGKDVIGGMLGGEIGWTNITVRIVGDGEHEVKWCYEKDKTGLSGDDCAWLDEVLWQVDQTVVTASETGSKDVVIGRDWIEQYLVAQYGDGKTDAFRERFGTDFDMAVRKPNGKIVNGKPGWVWQDYVAGTDPTDPNSVFSASIEMKNGTPEVTWKPNLGASRTYTIWGKPMLHSGVEWSSPTNSTHRFFKVTVDVP